MPKQYMRPDGLWLESCDDDTPSSWANAIPAPADADGFHGAEGLRWGGDGWTVYTPPPGSCTRFEGLRALGRVRVGRIKEIMANLEKVVLYEIEGQPITLSEDEAFAIRTAWEEAGTFERMSPDLAFVMWMFSWGDDMRDDFFRWIGEGNIAVFPDK